MSRTGRRVSRSLIGILLIVIILGLVSFLKNSPSASKADAVPATPAPTPLASVPTIPPAPVETAPAPTGAPAPDPVLNTSTPTGLLTSSLASAAPATQPNQIALAQNPTASSPAPTATIDSKNILVAAASKKEFGDLLGARKVLNNALLSNQLSAADTTSAKKQIAEINQTVVFSSKRFADDEFGGTYSVQPSDVLQKIAARHDLTWEILARLNNLSDPKRLRAGQTIKTVKGPFNAVVYKKSFMMDIYLGPPLETGSMYITSYPVGLGKDDSTPTGAWQVEAGKKLKNPTYYSPRGEGVVDADNPKNPLGERWIGLTGIDGHALGKASYGIHGTIDESSIGRMDSMGCIRLHNADVEWVFDLLVEGKSVVVVKE